MRPPRPVRAALNLLILPILALLPLACSGAPRTVPPRQWARSVCLALSPWRGQIQQLSRQVEATMATATTPRQTKTNLVTMLAGAERASETARVRVAAAGVPDVSGGQVIADRFVASLAAIRDAYGNAWHTIDKLDTSRAQAFYDDVAAAWQRLESEYSRGQLDTSRLSSTQLRQAFDEVPECR